jgi:hypothetical protein
MISPVCIKIKEITAYKTKDGKIFEIYSEAEKHQSILDFKHDLASVIADFKINSTDDFEALILG